MRYFLCSIALLSASLSYTARAQQPERAVVHPELVDSTWGRRTMANWRNAWDQHWEAAQSGFAALHEERPQAVEPMLGLGFVARGEGRFSDARRWYRSAFAVEPTADIRSQLDAAMWDRPTSLELVAGSAATGVGRQSQWSASFAGPVSPRLSLNARAGALGGGDPVRGIFLDSANGGGLRATVVAFGAVLRPTGGVTTSARVEEWSANGNADTFAWVDVSLRTGSRSSISLAARPLSGRTGAPRVGAGADVLLSPSNDLSMDVMQGTRSAPFEARTTVRAFDGVTLSRTTSARVGLIRDIDNRFAATTGLLSGTHFLSPVTGIRAEVTVRRGAFARTSLDAGLVLRW